MISRGTVQKANQGEERMRDDRITPVVNKEALCIRQDVIVVKIAMLKSFRYFEIGQRAA
jgi:hypothetical protein